MPNETRATRYHRARLQAGAGAFLVSLLVLVHMRPAGPARCWPARWPLCWVTRAWPTGRPPRPSPPSSSSSRMRRAIRSIAIVNGPWKAATAWRGCRPDAGCAPTCRARRADHGRNGRGACRGGDVALVRQRLVARDRCRLLPGPSRLDGGGAAAARRLRRAAAAAPPVAGGTGSTRCPAVGRRPRGARMARRRRDGAGARGARRPRPDPAGPALGHARRLRCATRRSRSSSPTRSAPRPRRRLAGGGVAARRAAADDGAAAVVLAWLGAPVGAWPFAPALSGPWASLPDALPWLPVSRRRARRASRARPIGLALSRGRELRADAYAIRLTGRRRRLRHVDAPPGPDQSGRRSAAAAGARAVLASASARFGLRRAAGRTAARDPGAVASRPG